MRVSDGVGKNILLPVLLPLRSRQRRTPAAYDADYQQTFWLNELNMSDANIDHEFLDHLIDMFPVDQDDLRAP